MLSQQSQSLPAHERWVCSYGNSACRAEKTPPSSQGGSAIPSSLRATSWQHLELCWILQNLSRALRFAPFQLGKPGCAHPQGSRGGILTTGFGEVRTNLPAQSLKKKKKKPNPPGMSRFLREGGHFFQLQPCSTILERGNAGEVENSSFGSGAVTCFGLR